jgi:protoporphyrin/coproporphyrin ferrochelatase
MKPSPAVLLIQLGTPDAPTAKALRPYLKQFLGDPRVIEAPRLPWWFVLNFLILPARPKQSAQKYQRIWDPQTGSPLLYHTRLQAEALQRLLPDTPVRFGMQVGSPSVAGVVHELIAAGCERLIVLPMYPQYSATTTASAFDVLFQALMCERRVPALRVVPPYYGHPAYINAVAQLVSDDLTKLAWSPDHYLISFHGIPIKYVERGDPYPEHVRQTTELLIKRLGWQADRWTQSFQSLFGRDQWLQPYTDRTLTELARKGVKRVFVAMPGFTADCLETIDEIGFEAREVFRHAGGEELHACPCLNEHPAWLKALHELILQEGQGWL